MSKQYEKASEDVMDRIAALRDEYHPELDDVSIAALFVFSDEPAHVLEHQGYPALAVTKIVGTKERAAGLTDALIVIDRYTYSGLTPAQMNAMLDHELYHLDRVIDAKTEQPKFDVLGRPKLQMRRHDRVIGAFDEILQRHGDDSIEALQVKNMLDGCQQIGFDFTAVAA